MEGEMRGTAEIAGIEEIEGEREWTDRGYQYLKMKRGLITLHQ